MSDILTGSFAPYRWQFFPPRQMRVVDWNIDRGLRLPDIGDFLASQEADLVILQEADLNAKRTHRVNIAEKLAYRLGMNYVFGREFDDTAEFDRFAGRDFQHARNESLISLLFE